MGSSFSWNVPADSEKHEPVPRENGGFGEGGQGQLHRWGGGVDKIEVGPEKGEDHCQVRGYIDVFLAEAAKEGEGREHYTEEQLIVTLIDFFTGGSGTMSESTITGQFSSPCSA